MKRIGLAAVVAAVLTLAGCAGGRYGYYASSAPPPIRVEARGYAPGPGYAWQDGSWGYGGGRYNWRPGNWVRAPRGRNRWEAGRWENRGGRYYYRDGRWR